MEEKADQEAEDVMEEKADREAEDVMEYKEIWDVRII